MIEIDISVEAGDWPDQLVSSIRPTLEQAMAQSGALIAGPAELSVVLTDNAHQRELNRQWRGIDKSTNVLSFPQIEPFEPVEGLLGDIILARETLIHEARDLGVPLHHHFTHLLVHGLLHILGHDHLEDEEATRMEALETSILSTMGIADPYADD